MDAQIVSLQLGNKLIQNELVKGCLHLLDAVVGCGKSRLGAFLRRRRALRRCRRLLRLFRLFLRKNVSGLFKLVPGLTGAEIEQQSSRQQQGNDFL